MARQIRILVSWGPANLPPRDRFSNTLYYQDEAVLPTNYNNIASDVRVAYSMHSATAGSSIDVRAYDMSDEEPRPIRGRSTATVPGTQPDGDPEVALCLSYRGDRNLPRQRGRIYLGPFPATALTRRPQTSRMEQLLDLGDKLAAIGGENISWRIHSPTTGDYHHIRETWVNDEWDVLRSRGLRETYRVTRSV